MMCAQVTQLVNRDSLDTKKRGKKHRRGKRKPYQKRFFNQSSDEECVNMAKMATITINQRNQDVLQTMCEQGKKLLRPPYSPQAPHNSTQFLIEDRLLEGPPIYSDETSMYKQDGASLTATPATGCTPYPVINLDNYLSDDELDTSLFMEMDFNNLFSDFSECDFQPKHCLVSMKSNVELISGILSLEERLARNEQLPSYDSSNNENQQQSHIQSLVRELEQLKCENQRLLRQNQILQSKNVN